MKTDLFIHRLSPQPTTISGSEIKAMEQFIENYPWCGIAHQLLLEALQQNSHEQFNHYVSKAAIYVVHREQLYHRLQMLKEQPATPKEAAVTLTKENTATIDDQYITLELLDDDSPENVQQETVTIPTPANSTKAKPAPIAYTAGDYFAGETIDDTAITNDPITRFIVERPQIRPIASSLNGINLPNQIEQATTPKKFEDIVTETLAKIYESQGLVSLALATYEKLSLLEPKKSTYFAALIQNLKLNHKF